MNKVIKEFKNKDLNYKLGYLLIENKVYPRIEIYKDEKRLSGGCWTGGNAAGLFYFNAHYSSSNASGSSIGCHIDKMFAWLRQYSDIPEYIEREYEKILILYKLNDFKELRED